MSAKAWLGLTYPAVLIAGIYGWVMNIVAIANSDFAAISGILVLRVVGIFLPPLGAVMGYV